MFGIHHSVEVMDVDKVASEGQSLEKNKVSILEPLVAKGVCGGVRCGEPRKCFCHVFFCLLGLKWIFPCLPRFSEPQFLCKNDLPLSFLALLW